MSSFYDRIDAIPAHAPEDVADAVLVARIVAGSAISMARRRAQSCDAGYHEDLRSLDVLVSVGMLDQQFVIRTKDEMRLTLAKALDRLLENNKEAA